MIIAGLAGAFGWLTGSSVDILLAILLLMYAQYGK